MLETSQGKSRVPMGLTTYGRSLEMILELGEAQLNIPS